MISYILALVTGALVLGIDQYTKYFISLNFEYGQPHDFIDGLLNVVYIHNRGGAWGVFQGKTWGLLIVTSIVMVICVIMLIKFGKSSKLCLWALSLVIFGGIGNMIDRIFRDGNVIDFLQFDFWQDFPVFNIADCAIVVGVGLLILYFVIDTIKEFITKKALDDENS